MMVLCKARYVRGGARKLRLLGPMIKGKEASLAMSLLKHTVKRGAVPVGKALASALANARQLHPEIASWRVKNLVVDEGPRMKRMRAGPMGRGMLIRKRFSHITVVLEGAAQEETKKNGTKGQSNRSAAGNRGRISR